MSLRQCFAVILTRFLGPEMLVVLGIVICLWALSQSPPHARSRVIPLPVRLLVLDAESGRPLADAQVRIFAVGSDFTTESLPERRKDYEYWRSFPIGKGMTDRDGVLQDVYRFSRFVPLSEYWVEIESDDGAQVTVPLGSEKTKMGELTEKEEISVSIVLHCEPS